MGKVGREKKSYRRTERNCLEINYTVTERVPLMYLLVDWTQLRNDVLQLENITIQAPAKRLLL